MVGMVLYAVNVKLGGFSVKPGSEGSQILCVSYINPGIAHNQTKDDSITIERKSFITIQVCYKKA